MYHERFRVGAAFQRNLCRMAEAGACRNKRLTA